MPALDLECAETQPPRGCCSAKTGSSYYKYGQLGAPVEYRPPLLRGKPEIPWQRYVDASAAREAWSKRDSRRATVIVLASRETDSELWGCGRIRPQRSHSPSCPTILNAARPSVRYRGRHLRASHPAVAFSVGRKHTCHF